MSERETQSSNAAVAGSAANGWDRLHEVDLAKLVQGIAARVDVVLSEAGTTNGTYEYAPSRSRDASTASLETRDAIRAWSSALSGHAAQPRRYERIEALQTTVLNATLARDASTPGLDEPAPGPEGRRRTARHVDDVMRSARRRPAESRPGDGVAVAMRPRNQAGAWSATMAWRRLWRPVLAVSAVVAGLTASLVLMLVVS